jgi:hypothetical protein
MTSLRILVAVCLAACLGVAAAHPIQPNTPARELVRLQGHRADTAAGAGVTTMVIAALGVDHPFAASDVRTFGFAEATSEPVPVGAHVVLQGPRDQLYKFTTARADQLVTILAERRAGGSDLFLLTIDLCPAK